MSRNTLLHPVLAAVLVLALLLPSAAAARGSAVSAPGWRTSFWDLLLQFLPLKNGSQIDPDGLTGTENDNCSQIDPDGLKNGWGIDPDGLTGTAGDTENDNQGTIDPNG